MSIVQEIKTHELKIWPSYYSAVADGSLRACARRHDRDYRVGDVLNLNEWDPATKQYTGRRQKRRITYILRGGRFGIDPDYSILSMASVDDGDI